MCPSASAGKPVILIGGTAGTGKSTLANRLLHRLSLDHRLGTGFVRAVIQSETTPERDPKLYSLTFQSEDPVANLRWQAMRLRPSIVACIDRARREGTSLVIEGTHLLPELYVNTTPSAFVVLAAPETEEHWRRINGPSHSSRRVTRAELEGVRTIDAEFRAQAERFGLPLLVYEDDDEAVIAQLGAASH
jgi:2-phosphoglycerate kinase